MRNQIANLYNIVSAPATGTQEALTERLQNECETGSLLYNSDGYYQEWKREIQRHHRKK